MQWNAIQYSAMQCNTIQFNTILYNTIQCFTIQYNTLQYNTIHYNGEILVYNICFISISNSVSDGVTYQSVLNIDSWAWCIEYFLSNAGLKTENFTRRIYELISTFATQKFWSFWKTRSRWILHPKSENVNHVLCFTSSLAAWSQYIPNEFFLCAKSYANDQKCKQWRQHKFPYTGQLYFTTLATHNKSWFPGGGR